MEKQALEKAFQKVLGKVGNIPEKQTVEKAFQNIMDKDDNVSGTIVDDKIQAPRKSFRKIANLNIYRQKFAIFRESKNSVFHPIKDTATFEKSVTLNTNPNKI